MKQLENLHLHDLKTVLKGLKLYADMKNKVGNRGKALFHRELTQQNSYKIEYTASMSENTAWEQGKNAFQKSFGVALEKEDVAFVKNEALLGGIKIFQNDDMVDLSLSKAINAIK